MQTKRLIHAFPPVGRVSAYVTKAARSVASPANPPLRRLKYWQSCESVASSQRQNWRLTKCEMTYRRFKSHRARLSRIVHTTSPTPLFRSEGRLPAAPPLPPDLPLRADSDSFHVKRVVRSHVVTGLNGGRRNFSYVFTPSENERL